MSEDARTVPTVDLEGLPARARIRKDLIDLERLDFRPPLGLAIGEFAAVRPNDDVWTRGPCGHLFRLDPARYSAVVAKGTDLVTITPDLVCSSCGSNYVVAGGRVITDARTREILLHRGL